MDNPSKNEYRAILEKSRTKRAETMRKMRHLSRMNRKGFDRMVHDIHDEVFAEIDCRKCGECCRNLGPVFRNSDIKLICSAIGLGDKAFMDTYLEQDPDGVGFILKRLPCPFQEEDNACSIYEERPLACSNFPHTQSVNIQRKLVGLALDSQFCPAAFLICERIIEAY